MNMKPICSSFGALVLLASVAVAGQEVSWKEQLDDAMALREKGRLAEAATAAEVAVKTAEKELGPSHPDLARSLEGLAVIYSAQAKRPQAEELLRRGLAIREKALGLDHPDVAQSLNKLGTFIGAQAFFGGKEKYAEAESLQKHAIAIWEKTLGPEHPEVGRGLRDLGRLYMSQNRLGDAETSMKRS